jgi:metallo-beta-lactamase family protein
MLSGGRVLHHLRRCLPNKRNLIALVGYQAAGTRGRALLEGARTLRLHGRDVPVRAEFISIHGLSAHADRDGLLRWVGSAGNAPPAIFVTHGEPDSAMAIGRNRKIIHGEKRVRSRYSTPPGAVLAFANAHIRERMLRLAKAAPGPI